MRSTWRLVVAVTALPFLLSGCVFNLGCEIFGSLTQAKFPGTDVCSAFSGDCCPDANGDGLPEDCSNFLGFSPCGRFDTEGCFCFGGGDFIGIGQTLLPPEPNAYALPPEAFFALRSPFAGFSSPHRVFFDIVADTLQTFTATVTYSDGFDFRGFLALGPAETQIGAYAVDMNLDFEPDITLPLRALTNDLAYVDGNANKRFDAADPTVTHTAGSHVFTTVIPRGGDGLGRVKLGPIQMRAIAALYSGLLVNPTTPGDYSITSAFTSVDPDSGDADDGTGQAPTSFSPAPETVPIVSAGYEAVPPFLCYKTKPTKGTLCGGTAAANAGGACASDAECGGTAGACVKTPLAKGTTATVDDGRDFPSLKTVTLGKPATLCAPAALFGASATVDGATHLRGYQVKPVKGTRKHEPLLRMTIENALGTIILDTKKRDRVLMVSAKSLAGPAGALGTTAVDNLSCYTVKTSKKRCAGFAEQKCKKSSDCGVDGPCFTGLAKTLSVQVADQFSGFATPKTLKVTKATRICYAADVNGIPLVSSDATFVCYQVKPGGAAKHTPIVGQIHTTNAIARERIDTVKEDEICLPSIFTGVS